MPHAAHLVDIFEKLLASDTYFDFSHIYNNLITAVIVRAYPMKAAGEILNYSYNCANRAFHCEINESRDMGSSIIYVPHLDKIKKVSIEPYGMGYTTKRIGNCNSGYICIPAVGNKIVRRIEF